jgi:hypothetical protein
LLPEVNEIETEGVTAPITVKGTVLPLIVDGLLPTTRIRYPVPPESPEGTVALIVPELLDTRLPITVGLVKLPELLLNSAVKVLLEKEPVLVYTTETEVVVAEHPEEGVPELTVIVAPHEKLETVSAKAITRDAFFKNANFLMRFFDL